MAQDKQVEKARKQADKGQAKLKDAKIDSAADYHQFVKDAKMDISENKKSIATLKSKKTATNTASQESYVKKLLALEKENGELEKKIDNSTHIKTTMWARFKLESIGEIQ